MTRRLFGKAGFVQVIFDISREFGSPYHFVDMILRRLNYGASIWICLTKPDGGNLNGSLNLDGFLYLRQQCRPMIIRIVISRLALDGLLIASVWNAAAVGSRPIEVSPQRVYLASLCPSDPRPA